jgi:hypothetical protein
MLPLAEGSKFDGNGEKLQISVFERPISNVEEECRR